MNHHSEKLAVLRVEVGSQDVEAFEVLGQATRLTVPDEYPFVVATAVPCRSRQNRE
jgi:hypothetical protein